MKQFTEQDLEGIVKAMNPLTLPSERKIPMKTPQTVGPISKVEFTPFPEQTQEYEREKGDFEKLQVTLEVVFGTKTMTLEELSNLHLGSLMTFEERHDHPVEVLANGKRVGRGEIVTVDGHFGIKLTEFEE